MTAVPVPHGDADEIRARLARMRAQDLPTHGGRTLAYVYDSGIDEADRLGREALAAYGASNGLDPTAFPSLLTMEQDLIGFAKPLVHAPDEAVGTVTSGGTESVLLAVLTARDAHPEIDRPAMVVPTSIHAAFHKAAHYFGVELIAIEVESGTLRADPAAMAAAMSDLADRVVLIAASAPSYAHGVVDPIPEIAAIAQGHGVRFHVDACIGGWVLPWLERDGQVRHGWDFAVDGVTSVSVDLHKYAYTPKGVSVLMHRNPQLRRAQYFASADWPGYTMLNSTVQSTKSGGPLAAAWAVVNYFGDAGYHQLTRTVHDATTSLAAGIRAIDHLDLAAEPDTTLVAVTTDEHCDVFTIADEMLERGWFVQPQMAFRELPATLHLSVSAATAPHVPDFLSALEASVAAALASGPVAVDEGLRTAAGAIDPGTLDDAAFDALLGMAGLAAGEGEIALPERMAPVNALLDLAPARLREALLIAFLDRLMRTG